MCVRLIGVPIMFHVFEMLPFRSTVSRHSGTWIKVERAREQHTLDLHMGVPWETVTLTSFGRNKQLYFNILEEGIYG